MAQHVKILGVLHIIFGSLCVLGGIIAMIAMGGIAAIVGASDQAADNPAAIPVLALIGAVVGVLCLVLGIPGIVAGIGVMQFKSWGRIVMIVLSAVDLLNIPFGTALGIYGLWVMLNKETEQMFLGPPASPMPARP